MIFLDIRYPGKWCYRTKITNFTSFYKPTF